MAPGGALRHCVVACLATAVLLLPAAPAAAANEDFFGINGQVVFDLPSSAWDTHLAAMSRGGLQLVRRDAPWGSAEPSPPNPLTGAHTYVWAGFDARVAAYARRGLRWLPIIDYSAPWAAEVPGDKFSPPARASDYAAYAAALARRYGRGGSFWRAHPELPQLPVTRYEIWNEQNTTHFWHPQDRAPERYAELYLAARTALKAVDPAARVIVGGLALENSGVTSETAFIERMYAHRPNLKGNVDAIGFHPYTPTVDGVYSKLREFRGTLRRVGAGAVPLEITEIGWTTTSTSDSARGAMLARLAEELPRSDCGVASLLPHTWLTHENDPSNGEAWFGIANANGTLKASGSAYLAAVGRMRRSSASGPVRVCGSGSGADETGAAGAETSARGPKLRLRVRRHRRHRRWVVVTARCPSGCRLRLRLVPRSRASGRARKAVARRSLRFSRRRRRIVLRARGRQRILNLHVRARGRSGALTKRVRRIRLRRR